MTGKELKEFAGQCHDNAIIKVRERGYGEYEVKFSIQAVVHFEADGVSKVEAAPEL